MARMVAPWVRRQRLETLARERAGAARVGAGTVPSIEGVARAADAGGHLIVSPDTRDSVNPAAKAAGIACNPGILAPAEGLDRFAKDCQHSQTPPECFVLDAERGAARTGCVPALPAQL